MTFWQEVLFWIAFGFVIIPIAWIGATFWTRVVERGVNYIQRRRP